MQSILAKKRGREDAKNRWLFIGLLFFLAMGINTQEVRADDWFRGGTHYLWSNYAFWDNYNNDTGIYRQKIYVQDFEGYNEWWKYGLTLEVTKDGVTRKLGVLNTAETGGGQTISAGDAGKVWLNDISGSSNDRRYVWVNWKLPTDYLNKKIKIHAYGTWYNSGPGKSRKVDESREFNSTIRLTVQPITRTSAYVGPDGKLTISWRLTGSMGSVDEGSYIAMLANGAYDGRGTEFHNLGRNSSGTCTRIPLSKGPAMLRNAATYTVYHEKHMGGNTWINSYAEPYKFLGYPYPENVVSEFDQRTKKITVRWSKQNTGGNMNGVWRILRNNKNVAEVGSYQSSWVDNGISYEENYQYTVTWIDNEWKSRGLVKSDDKVEYLYATSSSVSTKRTLNMNLAYSTTDKDVLLNWTTFPFPTTYKLKFKVLRDGVEKAEITPKAEESSFSWKDSYDANKNPLSACTPHNYEVRPMVPDKNNVNKYMVLEAKKADRIAVGNKTKFVSCKVSKGTQPGKVKISWQVERADPNALKAEIYVLERKVAETDDENYQELYRTQSAESYFTYTDDNVQTGVYYEYRALCYTYCEDSGGIISKMPRNTVTDVGFAQATGTVTGRVTYGNGTAVANASISMVYPKDDTTTGSQYYSLHFDDSRGKLIALDATIAGKIFRSPDFTMQFWINPDDTKADQAFIKWGDSNTLSLKYLSGAYNLQWNKTIFTGISIKPGQFTHVALVCDDGVVTCSVVDEKSAKPELAMSGVKYSGNTSNDYKYLEISGFTGYLDEFRVYKRALDKTEILGSYDRIITGNENGLEIYWKFDENLRTQFFDYSREGSVYHERHGKLSGTVKSEPVVPEQLALKTTTDENGNYVIKGAPFSGDGTTYEIVPGMGIHEFEPARLLRYVSSNALVHNGTDFKDISAFKFVGKAVYEHGNYPVGGATVYIDGSPVAQDAKVVTTGSDGTFTIDVPIGSHQVSVGIAGHTFAHEGCWPEDGSKHAFWEGVGSGSEPVLFTDITKVRIAGRVAGGAIESGKPVGFRKGKANIGRATVVIRPVVEGFLLNGNAKEAVDMTVDATGKIESSFENTAVLKAKSDTVLIETDPETGEFFAVLPPIAYKLVSAKTKDYSSDINKAQQQDFGDLSKNNNYNFTPEVSVTETDTARILNTNNKEEVISFEYHKRIDIIQFNPAVIEMQDVAYAKSSYPDRKMLLGDSVYTYYDEARNKSYALGLINEIPDGKDPYKLGAPVFTKENKYMFELYGYERYVNKDNAGEETEDIVPLEGLELEVNNAMSSLIANLNSREISISEDGSLPVIKLGKGGKAIYKWTAGFPNLTGNNMLSLQFSYQKEGDLSRQVYPEQPITGYVLGDLPQPGANFVTAPDAVDYVLHDPCGSTSSAWLEKGSAISNTYSTSTHIGNNTDEESTLSFGPSTTIGVGLGVMVITETEIVADVNQEFHSTLTSQDAHSFTTRTETLTNISTSDSPDYVGAMGDVFIGRGMNNLFGTTDCLALYPVAGPAGGVDFGEAGRLELRANEEILNGLQFSTTFNYTQNHIEGYLIPATQKKRNALLTYSAHPETETNKSDKVMYFTSLPTGEDDYGEEGTYTAVFPAKSDTILVNEVKNHNSWISQWKKVLADNEKAKVDASRGKGALKMKNVSFDAGSSVEESITTVSTEENVHTFEYETEFMLGGTAGGEVMGIGTELKIATSIVNGKSEEEGDETENSKTFGYHLSDDGQGDYFTVDVYEPKDNQSHIFVLRGGQSSCPWEKGLETQYYLENGASVAVGSGTQAIDAPKISFNGGFKHSSMDNIRSGKEVSFVMNLENTTATDLPVWYKLYIDSETNPDGLVISVDGSPLVNGREYLIEKGRAQTKTVVVRQSKLDVYKYKGIKMILASACQGDPSADVGFVGDEVTFDINFIPSSSDVAVQLSSPVVNGQSTGTNGETSVLKMNVSGYDLSMPKFTCIELQYKKENAPNWNDVFARYYRDQVACDTTHIRKMDGIKTELIDDKPSFVAECDMSPLMDGNYVVRAVAYSEYDDGIATVEGEGLPVIKDTKRPEVLGKPSPVNGVLTPEGEISLMFNETINTQVLSNENFKVRGVLNDRRIAHSEAISLSAGNTLSTSVPVSLASQSFSIEGWIKRTPGQSGTLWSHGSGANALSIGFTADDFLSVEMNGTISVGDVKMAGSDWEYLSVWYDAAKHELKGYLLEEATGGCVLKTTRKDEYVGVGRLYVGSKPDGSDPVNAKMHEMTLWNQVRDENELADRMSVKNGREIGLLGYWPMDEATGGRASDKVRNRHLLLSNENMWYVNSLNGSMTFGGGTDKVVFTMGDKILPGDDFAIEFWLKGQPGQKSVQLFDTPSFRIGYNAEGCLVLITGDAGNPKENVLSTESYLDNGWHHVALNMIRGANTTLYVDGVSIKQLNASSVESGMSSVQPVIGEGLVGYIDEFRMWKGYVSGEFLKLNMRSRLTGKESGLINYLPFEELTVQNGLVKMEPSLADAVVRRNESEKLPDAKAEGAVFDKDVAPVLKSERPVENVAYNWTVSDNKIVLNINEALYRMENATLEFMVEDVSDKNGNSIGGPISWTAYVDMNRLKWDAGGINLVQEVLSRSKAEVTISNQSGKAEVYVLNNLPSWLEASKSQGTLKPLSSETITFIAVESTPIGSYEGTVYLSGNNQVDEPLAVSLKVTGERPDWSFDPGDFQGSMNMIGMLKFEGYVSEDTEDEVGAFVNGKCVGLASPIYIKGQDAYYVMADIYGNTAEQGKKIVFKAWDASTGRIYPSVAASEKIVFSTNSTWGSFAKPVELDAQDVIEQTIPLRAGWNWMSLNVEAASMAVEDAYSSVMDVALWLKSKTASLEMSTVGSGDDPLTTVNNREMYMLQLRLPAAYSLVGSMVKPAGTPITVAKGWNWIGYTPQQAFALDEALAGLEANEGDMIKGQSQFAVYSGEIWEGSLKYLNPGRGYMYKSTVADDRSFCYPAYYGNSRKSVPEQVPEQKMMWEANASGYPGNMTVVAVVKENGKILENCEVGVFNGEECRGVDYTRTGGRAYLTIAGDQNPVVLTFKVYDRDTERVIDVNQTLVYRDNEIIGSSAEPYVIEIVPASVSVLETNVKVYPVRVKKDIHVVAEGVTVKRVEITDMNGRVLLQRGEGDDVGTINLESFAAGAYIVVVRTGNGDLVKRIMKVTGY